MYDVPVMHPWPPRKPPSRARGRNRQYEDYDSGGRLVLAHNNIYRTS